MSKDLSFVYSDLKGDETISLVKSRIASGEKPAHILDEIRKGMLGIMERYESREYSQVSVTEGAEIYKEIKAILAPSMSSEDYHYIGKLVIGQAYRDIHEMGRNLFADLLETIGFEVFNLGADVPPEKFVEALKRTGATILCIGAIVTNGLHSMKDTVEAVHKAGLKPKVLIGGGVTVDSLKSYVGADAQAQDMVVGARICLSYVKGGNND